MSNGANPLSRKESFAGLNHRCKAAEIWLNDPENTMTLEELKALTTKELTALYNNHAERQVTRMESRSKLEERTIQLLREQGKLDETSGKPEAADANSVIRKPRGKPRDPATPLEAKNIRETANAGINDGTPMRDASNNKRKRKSSTDEEGTEDMATATKAKGKKAPAKKAAKTAKPAPAAKKEANGKRGAPLSNHTYVAISEKSKNFNPGGNKLQPSSARGIIFNAIQKKDGGLTRTKLEEMFPEQNVKSAVDVLIKFGFIQTA